MEGKEAKAFVELIAGRSIDVEVIPPPGGFLRHLCVGNEDDGMGPRPGEIEAKPGGEQESWGWASGGRGWARGFSGWPGDFPGRGGLWRIREQGFPAEGRLGVRQKNRFPEDEEPGGGEDGVFPTRGGSRRGRTVFF